MKLLVTGGAGFIGSAFVRRRLASAPDQAVLTIDALTYAGSLDNLAPVARMPGFGFEQADIRDAAAMRRVFRRFRPEAVVHFAAESHVDRSIREPGNVIATNVQGTATLLEAAREAQPRLFLHVSTDEVYGSLESPREADEGSPLRPSSPYAASKAGSDLIALAYGATYSLPVAVTRAANNYGPRQFPEKLIPLMIAKALEDRPLPVYGDGRQVRDWLYVDDHCRAVEALLASAEAGQVYNIPGVCALSNLEVVRRVLRLCGKPESLIEHVRDRPAHDRRYALSGAKLARETGWAPAVDFDVGLRRTVDWYRRNPQWVARALAAVGGDGAGSGSARGAG